MNSIKIKGISIPIAFNYAYRGQQYGEVEVYFSFISIKTREVDLLEPGNVLSKKINNFINRNIVGSFEFLIPYKITEIKSYEAPHDMRFNISLADKTLQQRL